MCFDALVGWEIFAWHCLCGWRVSGGVGDAPSKVSKEGHQVQLIDPIALSARVAIDQMF